jgi:heterodisulfide reductase subunit C
VGLPEEPPSTVRDKKALEELQKLMRKTALAELGIIPMGESGIRESCEV